MPSSPISPKLLHQAPRVVDGAALEPVGDVRLGDLRTSWRTDARTSFSSWVSWSSIPAGSSTSNGGRLLVAAHGVSFRWAADLLAVLPQVRGRGRWPEPAPGPRDRVPDLRRGGRRRRGRWEPARGRAASAIAAPMSLTARRRSRPRSAGVPTRPCRPRPAAPPAPRPAPDGARRAADWTQTACRGPFPLPFGPNRRHPGPPGPPAAARTGRRFHRRRRSARRGSAASRTARWTGAGCPSGRGWCRW